MDSFASFSYLTLNMDSKTIADAKWYYPELRPLADFTKGRIISWKDARIIKTE